MEAGFKASTYWVVVVSPLLLHEYLKDAKWLHSRDTSGSGRGHNPIGPGQPEGYPGPVGAADICLLLVLGCPGGTIAGGNCKPYRGEAERRPHSRRMGVERDH